MKFSPQASSQKPTTRHSSPIIEVPRPQNIECCVDKGRDSARGKIGGPSALERLYLHRTSNSSPYGGWDVNLDAVVI